MSQLAETYHVTKQSVSIFLRVAMCANLAVVFTTLQLYAELYCTTILVSGTCIGEEMNRAGMRAHCFICEAETPRSNGRDRCKFIVPTLPSQ